MSSSQRISLLKDDAIKPQIVHLLPCHIKYSGPAKVNRYFQPETITSGHSGTESTQQIAYFRGRKLLGVETVLPEGYKGTIYAPSQAETVSTRQSTRRSRPALHSDENHNHASDEDDDDDGDMEELSVWTPHATFKQLIEYGNNELPQSKLLEWIALAEAIHGKSKA